MTPTRCTERRHRAHALGDARRRRTSATRIRTSTATATIAVVHNGIIENSRPLRTMLKETGHTFVSETDTEVLAHLIEAAFDGNLEDAVIDALALVEGTYGIAVISSRGSGQDRRARARAARCSSASARASTTSRATSRRFSRTRARSCTWTTARWRVLTRDGYQRAATSTRRRVKKRREPHRLGSRRDREGRLRPLHAQGDLRAAADDREHDARPPRRRRRASRSSAASTSRRRSCSAVRQHHHHRVRHELALGADRRDDDRGARAHPLRGGIRVGVPLPQPDRHATRRCAS